MPAGLQAAGHRAEGAAEHAAKAVGGGREGPAAQAAFRAAEMGAAVLRGAALEQLGGLRSQVEAMEKLVLLPIKVRLSLYSSLTATPSCSRRSDHIQERLKRVSRQILE